MIPLHIMKVLIIEFHILYLSMALAYMYGSKLFLRLIGALHVVIYGIILMVLTLSGCANIEELPPEKTLKQKITEFKGDEPNCIESEEFFTFSCAKEMGVIAWHVFLKTIK